MDFWMVRNLEASRLENPISRFNEALNLIKENAEKASEGIGVPRRPYRNSPAFKPLTQSGPFFPTEATNTSDNYFPNFLTITSFPSCHAPPFPPA